MDNQPHQLPQPIRLNKFLAERLGVSRREADELITAGKVSVNKTKAKLGTRIDKNDEVCYNNKIVPFDTEFLYLAFNKPVGYVCSRRSQGGTPTLYELLPEKYQKLKTVGRLDKDSSGLILLTNDGDFAFQMTHPKFHKEKVYEVLLDRPLAPFHQQMISDYGVMLDDGPSKFTVVRNETPGPLLESVPKKTNLIPSYLVSLSEGRNRQIRRTFAALGYRVVGLHRIQFGNYELKDLSTGKYVIIKP